MSVKNCDTKLEFVIVDGPSVKEVVENIFSDVLQEERETVDFATPDTNLAVHINSISRRYGEKAEEFDIEGVIYFGRIWHVVTGVYDIVGKTGSLTVFFCK